MLSIDVTVQYSNKISAAGLIDLSLVLNTVLNCSGKVLDLLIASEFANAYVTRTSPLSSPEDAYHSTFEVTLEALVPLLPCPEIEPSSFSLFS